MRDKELEYKNDKFDLPKSIEFEKIIIDLSKIVSDHGKLIVFGNIDNINIDNIVRNDFKLIPYEISDIKGKDVKND